MASAIVLPVFNYVTEDILVTAMTVTKSEITALQAVASGLAANTGTATASSGAATLSKSSGLVTSEALTTAAAAIYTLTLTNTLATASSIVTFSVGNGTNTTVGLVPMSCTPASGSIVFKVLNNHASAALNGTIKIAYNIVVA